MGGKDGDGGSVARVRAGVREGCGAGVVVQSAAAMLDHGGTSVQESNMCSIARPEGAAGEARLVSCGSVDDGLSSLVVTVAMTSSAVPADLAATWSR
jgi:hypothetical protein